MCHSGRGKRETLLPKSPLLLFSMSPAASCDDLERVLGCFGCVAVNYWILWLKDGRCES